MAIQLGILVFAVIVHEVSHGYVAYKLGDPTAKNEGRLTLNPIPHIDPMWSILLPAFFILSHSPFLIGGAKPVPVNSSYFKKPRRDVMLVSLAGPGSNIVLALLFAVLLKLIILFPVIKSPGLELFAQYGIMINMVLAAFNLIPIPPLDGSGILSGLLPLSVAYNYGKIAPYGIWILMGLLYFGLVQYLMAPVLMVIKFIITFIIGS